MLKKWFLLGLIVILFIVWQSILIYQTAGDGKKSANNTARNIAMERYPIAHINKVMFYHGSEGYHVIDAKLMDKRHVYIWIPDEKYGRYVMLPVSYGYSKSEILKAFKSHVPYKKIISTRLGMEDGTPVWEMTYIDTDGGYVFSYYDFDTGNSIIEPISIK